MIAAARAALAAAWAHTVVGIGIVLLALVCFTWALVATVLNLVLPADAGRRAGRRGAMGSFRFYLAAMETLGAWRLDITELDRLRDAGPLIIAPNHPCLLDAVMLVSRLPDAVCVMKGSLLATFWLGPASRLARYVPNDSLIRLVARAGDELRLGGQLLLFPEGTRSTAQPIGPFTDAVGALSRRTGFPVQAVIIEADTRFLGKGWRPGDRPRLPLSYRVRIGRRFEPPRDVRSFTVELERYFTRELAHAGAGVEVEPQRAGLALSAAPIVEDRHRLRG
jgi:1-acyl-sn-glycerol-3-phosphate acyltransferase